MKLLSACLLSASSLLATPVTVQFIEPHSLSLDGFAVQAETFGRAPSLDATWRADELSMKDVPAVSLDYFEGIAALYLADHPEAHMADLRFLVPHMAFAQVRFDAPVYVVEVATPEPGTGWLLVAGFISVYVVQKFRKVDPND